MAERTAEEIQRDIEQARDALAGAVDQLAVRLNPRRLADDAKQNALAWAQTQQGRVVLGAAAALASLLVVGRIRAGRRSR